MSQPNCRDRLRATAKARSARIALPEVSDPRISAARATLEREGLAEVVWVPEPERDEHFEAVVEHVVARRRHKGVDRDAAVVLARQPVYYAAGLVGIGAADASVAGAAHATPDVIRAGIHCVGTAAATPLVSSMFLMLRDTDGLALSYADCGVVPVPDAEQLAAIAATTAANHLRFTGEEPRVAFLSFSTKGSAEHPDVETVRLGCAAFRKAHPDIAADGELQFDAAFVPAVAEQKAPGSPVAGRANVFVFPDLGAGNIAYKITQRLGGFDALGPLIQGLARPCLDLSRGCSAEDVVDVAVIAAAMLD